MNLRGKKLMELKACEFLPDFYKILSSLYVRYNLKAIFLKISYSLSTLFSSYLHVKFGNLQPKFTEKSILCFQISIIEYLTRKIDFHLSVQ